MSKKQRRVILPGLLLLATAGASALVVTRTRATTPLTEASPIPVRKVQEKQEQTIGNRVAHRNLSLQPEAFKMSRKIGKRFASSNREQSVLVGTLLVGSERHNVRIMRGQTDDGEQVEIALAGSHGPLTWGAKQGAKAAGERATDDRDLIERLALDSPDQFILAQLRGASYYTVARNVLPEGAGEDYAGPIWNIVRVEDAAGDEAGQPLSPWRLYYINTVTGLIDRIVSDEGGQTITAELSGWTEVGSEKVPSMITWSRQGQAVMQFTLSNFSHGNQQ